MVDNNPDSFGGDNDGFTHTDSRGMEADTFMLPGIVDEEELEYALECMPFWDALEQCVVHDQTIARVNWSEDYYLWVHGATDEIGNTIMTFSKDQGCPTPYTPTQDDMLTEDWIMLSDSVM